ncbi:cytochrome P450 [Henriciella litoralis]|uniref:cytochrome P450 n=1 Tax=Henriciella litoralis TaxID=568102 RepID=UPI000A06BE1A|nr:cytochrome P450 [Henriciella litoralis]
MQIKEADRIDPYENQRTEPGPVHAPVFPVDLQIDLTAEDAYLDGAPMEDVKRLSDAAPIFWHPENKPYEPGFWVLTRHEDIRYVSQNPGLFSSAVGAGALLSFETSGWDMTPEEHAIYMANMVQMDPPEHKDYRALIMPYLGGPAVKRIDPIIRQKVGELVGELKADEPFDLVSRFSAITPGVTLCHLLGVPPEDRETIVEWGDTLAGSGDPEYAEAAAGLHAKIYKYGWDLLNKKKEEPGNDLLSAAIKEYSKQEGGKLRPGSMEGLFTLMVVAGHRTTRNTTTEGLMLLYKHPEQLELLRSNPDLINNAVEEILRYSTVVPVFRRTALDDTELSGQKIAKGEKVVMWYSAANRDESVFEDPYKFDIQRPNAKSHLAFGIGEHMCAGNMLARLQIRTAILEFIQRFKTMEIVKEPEYLQTNQAVSIKRLIVKTGL